MYNSEVELCQHWHPSLGAGMNIIKALMTSRHNFLYNSSLIWNELIGKILEKSDPNPNNIMIPGSSPNSDLSASISLVKKRLKKYLLGLQEVDVPTRPNEWLPLNFCKFSLND